MTRKKKARSGKSKSSKKKVRISRKLKQDVQRAVANKYGAPAVIGGHGKYKSKGIGKSMGAAGGGALATALGMPFLAPLGSMAGGALGDLAESGLGEIISKIFGSGKYVVGDESMPLAGSIKKNAFILPEEGSHVEFGTDSKGDYIRVCKRELVGDVLSSTAAYQVAFSMPDTPCNSQIGPWMSQVANLFQEYTYDGLVFEYISLTSPTLVSGTPGIQTGGYVGFVTQMNPELAAPSDKQMALELQSAQTAAPWKSQLHPVECERGLTNQPDLFVEGRSGVPSNSVSALYRHATTYLIVGEQPSANVKMGEVWCSQAVKLRYPSLDNPLPVNAHWNLSNATGGGTFKMFGDSGTRIQRTGVKSGISIETNPTFSGTVTFPSSRGSDRWYSMVYNYGNTTVTGTAYALNVFSMSPNITMLTPFSNFLSTAEVDAIQLRPGSGTTTAGYSNQFLFKVARLLPNEVSTNSVIFVTVGTHPATSSFSEVFIYEIAGPDQAAGLFAPLLEEQVRFIPPSQVAAPSASVDIEECHRKKSFADEAKDCLACWQRENPTASPDQISFMQEQAEKLRVQVGQRLVSKSAALSLLTAYAERVCSGDAWVNVTDAYKSFDAVQQRANC